MVERRVKTKFLLHVLWEISRNQDDLKAVQKSLNISKQSLQYYLKRLKRLGFLEKVQSYPFAVYSLTPMGARVKEIIVQSDASKTFGAFRVHAKIIGFPIKDFGSFKFSQKAVQMRGWSFEMVRLNYGGKQWTAHIQSTGLLKLYAPEIYTDSPDAAITQLSCTASRIAQDFERIYGMKVGEAIAIRPAHKELVRSEALAKLIGKGKFGELWVDNSTGTDWVEEGENSHKIEELFAMPAAVVALGNHIVAQTEIMDQFSRQMALHLDVLTDMKETLKKIREELSK